VSCCPGCLATGWHHALQVVDVNRTSKGARAGRVQGYSALVVVGNQKAGYLILIFIFINIFATSSTSTHQQLRCACHAFHVTGRCNCDVCLWWGRVGVPS
jgi:Ribosomal protein S5, N-terminal domain